MTMKLTRNIILFQVVVFTAVCKSDVVLPDDDWKINEGSCELTCKNGEIPRKYRNFRITEDRCGVDYDKPETRKKDIIPDIRWCCRDRDLCYHSCSKTLQTCEENFKECVERLCTSADCDEEAAENFLSSPSCPSFIAARQSACTCGPDDYKKGMDHKKPKVKVAERGTEEHKLVYIMPEDADEEEYIRENRLPEVGPPKMAPPRERKDFSQMRGDDVGEGDIYYEDHDEL